VSIKQKKRPLIPDDLEDIMLTVCANADTTPSTLPENPTCVDTKATKTTMIHNMFFSPRPFTVTAITFMLLLSLSTSSLAAAELQDRCGDCWCIWDGELDECPASASDTTGIKDAFPSDPYELFAGFTLKNPGAGFLQLESQDGDECYPFANGVLPSNNYPKSNLPQCQLQQLQFTDSTTTATASTVVCAYLYDQEMACQGRSYSVFTYESAQAAETAGAVVTHAGRK
jgi:hypothetical protein